VLPLSGIIMTVVETVADVVVAATGIAGAAMAAAAATGIAAAGEGTRKFSKSTIVLDGIPPA
jgi:hypothetical protein